MTRLNMDTTTVPEITRNLLLAIKPFHVVCKLFGLMPFTVDLTTASPRRCRSDLVIQTTACAAHLVSEFAFLYIFPCSVQTSSTTDIITLIGSINFVVMNIVPVISDAFFNNKKYENMLKLITSCDRLLTIYTRKKSSSGEMFIKLQLILFFMYFCLMFVGTFTSFTEQKMRLGAICCIYPMGTNILTVLWFLNLQLVIRQRISHLNTCILDMQQNLHTENHGQVHSIDGVVLGKDLNVSHRGACCMSEQVRSFRKVYLGLCELSVVVSSIHTSFLILLFIGLSVLSVIQLYFSFVDALFLGIDLQGIKWQYQLGMFFPTSLLALLVVSAHCVEAEAGRTQALCWRLLVEGRNVRGAAHRELQLLLLQTTSWRPQANLAGVLTLRMGLIVTYISINTTYTALMLTFWPSAN